MFFCKQKTAYEMRISDWSSDVCSSDLLRFIVEVVPQRPESYLRTIPSFSLYQVVDPKPLEIHNGNHLCGHPKYNRNIPLPRYMAIGLDSSGRQEDELVVMVFTSEAPPPRSAEHTSELQSLMRRSSADFCL